MMDYEHLPRDELLALLGDLLAQSSTLKREQQGASDEQAQLVHELRVYQVELEMQNRELREAQVELERSRDRYEELYHCAPVAYVTLSEHFTIEELNHAAVTLLGSSQDMLLGRSFLSMLRAEWVETLTALLSQAQQTPGQHSAELELDVAGRSIDVQVVVSSSTDESLRADIFRCALLDISERKAAAAERDRAHAAERRLHERFEWLDRLNVAMSTILATSERTSMEAVLAAVAENALSLLGPYAAEIKLAADVDERTYEVSRARSSATGAGARLRVSVPLRFGSRLLGELTVTCDADSGQSLTEVGQTLELLSERIGLALQSARLNELEARERARLAVLERAGSTLGGCTDLESTLAALAQVGGSVVSDFACCSATFVSDSSGLRVLGTAHENPRRQRLLRKLGLRLAALVSKSATAGSPLLHDTSGSPLQRLGRALGVQDLLVVPMVARQQTLGVMCFGRVPQSESDRRAALHVLEAIVSRAAAVLDMARVMEQLRTAVDSRDTLLAVVSHDLRSPLNAIMLTAGSLCRASRDQERRRSASQLQLILRSAGRMKYLVEDLLTASNIDTGHFSVEPSEAKPLDLLDDARTMNEPLVLANELTIECKCESDEAVIADRGRVLQVLTNLIGNAAKFTPAGGKITLAAQQTEDSVRFCVSDTGPGIAAHALSQVFVRYWTGNVQRSGSGLGLGLYIAEGIVHAHGGRIWVESVVGKGATFYFTLPKSERKAGASHRSAGVSLPVEATHLRLAQLGPAASRTR